MTIIIKGNKCYNYICLEVLLKHLSFKLRLSIRSMTNITIFAKHLFLMTKT